MSDDLQLYTQLFDEEILANFGGHTRLAHLRFFFDHLRELKVTMFVLSHGRQKAVEFFLSKVNLQHHFRKIICSDTPPLQAVGQEKGAVIMRYIQQVDRSLAGHKSDKPVQRVLFVDDSAKNLQVSVHTANLMPHSLFSIAITLNRHIYQVGASRRRPTFQDASCRKTQRRLNRWVDIFGTCGQGTAWLPMP